jgi:hypothetical protein
MFELVGEDGEGLHASTRRRNDTKDEDDVCRSPQAALLVTLSGYLHLTGDLISSVRYLGLGCRSRDVGRARGVWQLHPTNVHYNLSSCSSSGCDVSPDLCKESRYGATYRTPCVLFNLLFCVIERTSTKDFTVSQLLTWNERTR